MIMKRALVLSGGGSKGAFEVGALSYLLERGNFDFQIVTGTSVGALNAAYLGQARNHRELRELGQELKQLWLKIKGNSDLFQSGIFGNLWRLLFHNTLYNPLGLKRLIYDKIVPARLFHSRIVVKVTVVSFESGELLCVDSRRPELQPDFLSYVLASASIPFFFPPVSIAGHHWYDGGLRDLTPLSAAIKESPDEIVVITTFPVNPSLQPVLPSSKPGSALKVILRTMEILLSEISVNDLQLAQAINKAWWRYPGKKPIPIRIIAPPKPLTGDSLNFDAGQIRTNLTAGYEAAQTCRFLTMESRVNRRFTPS
jgi:NTE family protein